MKVLLTGLNSNRTDITLALRYLYSTSCDVCDSVEVHEFPLGDPAEFIYCDLVNGANDLVCFYCTPENWEKTADLAANLREAFPEGKSVALGPAVSFDSAELLRENPAIDFIIRGEGEYTLRCLLEKLEAGGTDFESIKGLTLRMGSSMVSTNDADLLVLESVPFPYKRFPCKKGSEISYESSRGCTGVCAHCVYADGKKVRELPVERVIADIDYFMCSGVKRVNFEDKAFTANVERAYSIFKFIMERDLGTTTFSFKLCDGEIDRSLVDLLVDARPGLFNFDIDMISRYENIHSLVSAGNCGVSVSMTAGLPTETYEAFCERFNRVYNLNAPYMHVHILQLLRGTKVRARAEEYHIRYRRKAPHETISTSFISAADIIRIKQIAALVEIYHNHGGFEDTLEYMTKIFAPSPFAFFEEFAIFYNLKGYQVRPHKKKEYARILMEYAEWKAKDEPEAISEIRYLLEHEQI